jgi:hypothetical protein
MNQTIEVLKNEDGQIKIRKLSESKISINYEIPIFCQVNDSVRIIDKLKIKIRYKLNNDDRKNLNEFPTYHLIPFKDRFVQILSQNWKIKKKFIIFSRKSGIFELDKYLISGIYCGIIFNDKSWARDYILNRILNEKRDNFKTH